METIETDYDPSPDELVDALSVTKLIQDLLVDGYMYT